MSFHIGQKVVCVNISGVKGLIQDKIYTVTGNKKCCTANTSVSPTSLDPSETTECRYCGEDTGGHFYMSSRFIPISEYASNEETVNEMIKESTIEIFQK